MLPSLRDAGHLPAISSPPQAEPTSTQTDPPPRVSLRQAAGDDAYTTLRQAAEQPREDWRWPPTAVMAPAPAGSVAKAQALADDLAALLRDHPNANLVGVMLSDICRKLQRNMLTAGPAAAGFFVGFLAVQGTMVESGFNRIFPIPARPFNPHGIDHRGQGAALIGWALAGGIVGSILLSGLAQAAGSALQARLQPGRRLPASPVADLLLADAGVLVGAHRRHILPPFVLGLAGFIVPQCIAIEAGFNFLDRIEARPFNPGGITNRTLGAALLGWSLSMSVLGGLPLGIMGGLLIGAGLQRALGPKT